MLLSLLSNFVEIVALQVFEVEALELSLLLFLDLTLHFEENLDFFLFLDFCLMQLLSMLDLLPLLVVNPFSLEVFEMLLDLGYDDVALVPRVFLLLLLIEFDELIFLCLLDLRDQRRICLVPARWKPAMRAVNFSWNLFLVNSCGEEWVSFMTISAIEAASDLLYLVPTVFLSHWAGTDTCPAD